MAYVSKVWVDRQTEYPTRRKLEFDDGTDDKIVTVSRAEGTIYEAGDIFDANTMNTLESRIAAGIAEKQDILIAGNGIRIDQDNVISATGGGGGIEFTKIENGSLVSVNDAADLPVVDLAVDIKATQSGTGNPSPSNVRPISGRLSVGVTRAGKNIIKYPYYSPDGTYSGLSFTTGTDGKITASGTTSGTLKYLLASGVKIVAGTYTLSLKGNHTGVTLYVRDVDNASNIARIMTGSTDASVSFTVQSDANNVDIYFNCATGVVVDISAYVQIELGSTATSFEPYNGTTVTIALGQTVYGGELDVTSGVLAITHGTVLFDGSESWSKNGETDAYINLVSTVSDLVNVANSDTVVRVKSDKFNGVSANTALGSGTKAAYQIAAISNSRVYVVMPKTVVDSAAAFRTWLESNNVQIVYEFAQPVTVQLTPTEIETLLGINNIWADSGDILNLEYYTQSASDVRDFIIKDEEVTDDASWSSEKIQDELDAKQETLTAGDGIVFDGNEISAVLYKELTATLNVFSTSVVFEDASITTSSVIDIYTSKYGFNPETVTAETGRLTITFRQPEEQISVKVRIS